MNSEAIYLDSYKADRKKNCVLLCNYLVALFI